MDGARRGNTFRSFLLGSLVGGVAAVAAAGRMKVRAERRSTPAGLAAFERAPCFAELVERENRERAR